MYHMVLDHLGQHDDIHSWLLLVAPFRQPRCAFAWTFLWDLGHHKHCWTIGISWWIQSFNMFQHLSTCINIFQHVSTVGASLHSWKVPSCNQVSPERGRTNWYMCNFRKEQNMKPGSFSQTAIVSIPKCWQSFVSMHLDTFQWPLKSKSLLSHYYQIPH